MMTAPACTFFLENLQTQLTQHLSDSSLDVQRLTRLVGMSRSDLHRKLSQATGMSTTEYMRYVRLRRAAELLLKQPNWSIYQVALEVGFANISYFSRRFKESFGVCPAAWRQDQTGR
ncbi:MAG: helix-turn-helix transcriptional regulator [Lewinellaceae bacterium]|nr:helix-turn-helix transcriptional regulator [Saprospiraceae bacterium]MCB9340603.1 helix-turn-helix transcriptional regulator [Lewinellaceae bacterium]